MQRKTNPLMILIEDDENKEKVLSPEKFDENGRVILKDVVMHNQLFDDVQNWCKVQANQLSHRTWRWIPVSINEWLLGEEYLNLKESIRPVVLQDITEFFKPSGNNPWSRVYEEGIFCEGIGSGKSFKTSCIASYFIHLLLCLRNPQKFFGVDSSSKIAIMNMCFAGDQRVRLSEGVELTFADLHRLGTPVEVTSYDVKTGEFKKALTQVCVMSGKKKIKKLIFGNGRELRLSGNHPLLTRDRDKKGRYTNKPIWKAVDDLKAGDIVKVGGYVASSEPSGFSSDELKLLAYIYGDSKVEGTGLQFISSYRSIVTDFKEVCRKFGITKFKEHDKGDLHCILAESEKLLELAGRAGLSTHTEDKRGLPPSLLQAPEEEVVLFLNRLWATYGSINIGHKLSINFTNLSEQLIRDLSDLLSRFGIITRYYKNNGKYKKDRNADIYRLSISDTQSKTIFMEKIGRYGLRAEGCTMVKGNMGKRFEWTNIESIKDDGEEETYDIGVPEYENLVVNGMVCHNSISEKNARSVIFSEIRQKILNCPWFTQRPWGREDARMPDEACMSELRFKNNLFIIPGSSSWRTAVGYNVVVGIIDEAGSYRATDNSDQAEDIYLTFKRRLGSRFEGKGALIIAGSPMYESDFLERRIEQGNKTGAKALVVRRTLWESKYADWQGEFFYVDRVNRIILDPDKVPADLKDIDKIPKVEFLFEAFTANVTKAYRDFGARPSEVIHGFFESPKVILDRVNRGRTEDPMDKLGRFKDWFKPITNTMHCIHVDLALSGDACGFALGHYAGQTKEGGIKVYIDLMIRIVGSKEHPIEIARVREYIYALSALGFKFGIITYDGFQSSDSMQILSKKGYRCEYLSVDRTMIPYNDMKEAINEDRLDYYRVSSGIDDEPSASEVFVRECMRLEEIEGKKIDHPPKGSKDVADAVAGVVHNVVKNHQSFVGVTCKII